MIGLAQLTGAVNLAGGAAGATDQADAVRSDAQEGQFQKLVEAGLDEKTTPGSDPGARHPVGDTEGAKGKGQVEGEKRPEARKAARAAAAAGDTPPASDAPAAGAASGVAAEAIQVQAAPVLKPAGEPATTPGEVEDKSRQIARKNAKGTADPGQLPDAPNAEAPVVASDCTTLAIARLSAGLRVTGGAQAEAAKTPALSGSSDMLPQSVVPVGGQVNMDVIHGSTGAGAPHAPVASDRGDTDPAAKMDDAHVLEASTGALEIGVANSTHGWLRVRAELDEGGAVVAQVTAASAAGAEGLRRELPAISAYLAQEQVGVSSLAVHAMEAAAGTQPDGAGSASAGFSFGAGGGDAGRSAGGGTASARQDRASTFNPASSLVAGDGASGVVGGINGGWLSVRV